MAPAARPNIDSLKLRIPLLQLLDLPEQFLDYYGITSINGLGLSPRPANCLTKSGISNLRQLLALTINNLYDIHAMGRGSIQDILNQLVKFVETSAKANTQQRTHSVNPPDFFAVKWKPYIALENALYHQLRLSDEWETFAYCTPAHFDIHLDPLQPETLCTLLDNQIADSTKLFDLTWKNAQEMLDEHSADELLELLIGMAAEQRAVHTVVTQAAIPNFDSRRQLLERRWGNTPVADCGFSARVERVLRAATIARLADLLDALEPLHAALCFDLPLFCTIWERLISLELRQGEARLEWERLVTDEDCTACLDDVTAALQGSCSTSQWTVLSARFGLEGKVPAKLSAIAVEAETQLCTVKSRLYRTLEDIALHAGLSRERIRQVELNACNNVKHSETSIVQSITETLLLLVEQAGGVISISHAAQLLTAYIPAQKVDPEGVCYLLMELSEQFESIERGGIYRLASIPAPHYSKVIGCATRICKTSSVNLHEDELTVLIREKLAGEGITLVPEFITACLEVNDRFSSELSRRDLNFLLLETLRRIGKPAHYSEVTAWLNASGWRKRVTTERTVNSRLGGEHDLFVYTSRGTYGLVEWGLVDQRRFDRLKNGLIGDHIEAFLIERNRALEVREIVSHVLTKKRCQIHSVQSCLYRDDRFLSFGRSKYGLKRWVM